MPRTPRPAGPTRNGAAFAAGIVFIILAAGFGFMSLTLDLGSARNMGPGFFPLVSAILLGLLGLASIFLDRRPDAETVDRVNLRGIVMMGAAPFLFLLVVGPFGLAPATFCVCLASCLAMPAVSLRGALVTALCMTALGMLVFSGLLGVSDPLFRLAV